MSSWKKKLEAIAKTRLTDSTHDLSHTLRVLSLAKHLARKEKPKCDMDVLAASCLLHDIAYAQGHEEHEKNSAKLAKAILPATDFPPSKIPVVCECISLHRFSKKKPAKTIEQKILQDADKLDAVGAVGIARCFLWTGKHDSSMQIALDHFPEKLLKLKSLMNTKSGRKLASERDKYMRRFLSRFSDETRGTL